MQITNKNIERLAHLISPKALGGLEGKLHSRQGLSSQVYSHKTMRDSGKIVKWCHDIKPCDRKWVPHIEKKVKIAALGGHSPCP